MGAYLSVCYSGIQGCATHSLIVFLLKPATLKNRKNKYDIKSPVLCISRNFAIFCRKEFANNTAVVKMTKIT